MNSPKLATRVLQAMGGLLVLLGFVHLSATSHMAALLRGSPMPVYERAVGPTLLNHVLVGILLVPLGFTTWLAAPAAERGEVWAGHVLVANTVIVFTLPVSILVFMRRAEYYSSPLFLSGVLLSVLTALAMVAATMSVMRRQYWGGRRSAVQTRKLR